MQQIRELQLHEGYRGLEACRVDVAPTPLWRRHCHDMADITRSSRPRPYYRYMRHPCSLPAILDTPLQCTSPVLQHFACRRMSVRIRAQRMGRRASRSRSGLHPSGRLQRFPSLFLKTLSPDKVPIISFVWELLCACASPYRSQRAGSCFTMNITGSDH